MGDVRLPLWFSNPQHYISCSSSTSPVAGAVAGADDHDGSSSLSSHSSSPLLPTRKSKKRFLRLPNFFLSTSRRSSCNTNGDYKPKKSSSRNFFMKFFTSPKKQSSSSTTLSPESCPWASPSSTISFDVGMEKRFVEEVYNASPPPSHSVDLFYEVPLTYPPSEIQDIIEKDDLKGNACREVSLVENKLVRSYVAYSMVLVRLWVSQWEKKLHLFTSMKFAGVHGFGGKMVFLLASMNKKVKKAMMIKGEKEGGGDDEEKVWYLREVKGLRCRPLPELESAAEAAVAGEEGGYGFKKNQPSLRELVLMKMK